MADDQQQTASLISRLASAAHDALCTADDPASLIINRTDCPIELCSKYQDVWEGTRVILAPGQSVSVRADPCNPHIRLGAFLDAGPSSLRQSPLVMIPHHALASAHHIELCASSDKALRAEVTELQFPTRSDDGSA